MSMDDDLDELTDEELLAEERALAAADRARASDHQLAGGAPMSLAWFAFIGGLIGVFASFQLVLADRAVLENPSAALSCDINPLIGCSAQIHGWQSKIIFGVPNALFGTAVFAMVAAVGLTMLAGARLSTWLWRVMVVSALIGFAFQIWFLYQSVSTLKLLCPWCMMTWAVVIVLGFQIIGRAAQAGHLPIPERFARFLCLERWLLTILYFVAVIAVIGVTMWSTWSLMLGI